MLHYLITEWNVDALDMTWLLERQELFEKFCLPSVLSQTCKDFEWVLVCDERTSAKFKEVLDSYPATILYYNFEGYHWGAPKQFSKIMQRSVDLEYIQEVLVEWMGEPKTDYVITSRLDSDDVISTDHIAKIQKYASEYVKEGYQRFWLNLTRGYKWHRGYVYPKNSNANPFISFVEPPHEIKTTYQGCHTEARNSPYKLISIREGQPTWLQVIHKGNLLNKLMRTKGKRLDTEIRDRFKFI